MIRGPFRSLRGTPSRSALSFALFTVALGCDEPSRSSSPSASQRDAWSAPDAAIESSARIQDAGGDAGIAESLADSRGAATTHWVAARSAPVVRAPGEPMARDAIAGVRCSVSRQGRLSPVGEFSARDVNGDAALDIVESVPALYAQSAGGLFILPTAARVTLPWARIARGERCVIDDRDARAFARSQCPRSPRTQSFVPPTALPREARQSAALAALACARAWGVDVAVIREALARRRSQLGDGLALDALVTFAAQLTPPWTLTSAPGAPSPR